MIIYIYVHNYNLNTRNTSLNFLRVKMFVDFVNFGVPKKISKILALKNFVL